MERRMKSIRALLVTCILVVSLSTCVNPFNWLAEVSDEVMLAKDMYLQVINVTPAKYTMAFNPEAPILIEFDRGVDLTSVTSTSVTISPTEDWPAPIFDIGTNTLTITPYSLEGAATYTVTLNSDVKGIDGSALRTPYTWSFTTDDLPTGGVILKDRSSLNTTYTNERYIDLAIEANGVVNQMRYSQTPFTKDDGALVWGTVAGSLEDYELAVGSDGERIVYIQFRKYSVSPPVDLRTEVKADSIILDTAAPTIVLNNPPTYIGTGGWTSNMTVTETGSGIASYAWSKYSGTSTVTLSPTDQLNTTVTPTAEGTLRLRLIVNDGAGNPGTFYTSTSPYITVDLTAPTAPDITSGPPNPLRGNPPTYTWVSTDATGADYFRYKYDTDSGWSTETADLTASPSAKYGARYFYVQERDAAGNWSTYDYWYSWIYPDWIEPRYAQTVDRSPTVRWADYPIIGGTKFDVFYRKSTTSIWTQLFNDTTTLAVDLPTGTLDASSTYYWYYTVTLFSTTTRIPYGTDYFRFYTNTFP